MPGVVAVPVNPLNPRQKFLPVDHVRVMVAEPPINAAAVNRLRNTSGAFGAFGWSTDKATEVLYTERVGGDPRRLEPSQWAARVSGLTGSITVLSATDILVAPTATAAAMGFEHGLTASPGSDYKIRLDGIPAFVSGGMPILWEVVTTPAAGAPAGTAWRLTQETATLTPGTIVPGTNAYMVNYGSHYIAEFQQLNAAETNVMGTIRSARIGVKPGDQIAMGLTFMGQPIRADTGAYLTTTTRQLWINYYKADGSYLTQVVQTAATIPAGITNVTYAPGAVPAGAAFAYMAVRVTWPTDIFGVAVEARMTGIRFHVGTAVLGVEEFPTFRNIFPGAHQLNIERSPLDASSIILTTSDPECDPATTWIRKGAAAMIEIAVNPGGRTNDRLSTMVVDDVAATYRVHRGELHPVTAVRFSDGNADLANTARKNGYAPLQRLVEVMEGVTVPYNVTGQTWVGPSTDPVDWVNENASALDQIAVTRDTHLAYAYLDRWGVMNVHSEDSGAGTIWTYAREWDVDESNFNATAAPKMSYADVINTVKIVAYRFIGDQTEEWHYGPFIDQDSVDRYGARSATFTVGVPIGTTVSATYWDAFVDEIFAKNAEAARGYEELSFFIDGISPDTPGAANDLFFATADHGDLLNVTSPLLDLVSEPFRIGRVRHEITPTKWIARFGLGKSDGVAAPTIQPDLASSRIDGTKNLTLTAAGGTGTAIAVRLSPTLVWCSMATSGANVATGSTGSAVATIPAGLRPNAELWAEGNAGGGAASQFHIAPGGNIQARHGLGAAMTVCRFGVAYYSTAT